MKQELTFSEMEQSNVFMCSDGKKYPQKGIVDWIQKDVTENKLNKGNVLSEKDQPYNIYSFDSVNESSMIKIEVTIDNPYNKVLKSLSIEKESVQEDLDTIPASAFESFQVKEEVVDVSESQPIEIDKIKEIRKHITNYYPEIHFGTLSEDEKINLVNAYIQDGEEAITNFLSTKDAEMFRRAFN